MISVGEVIERAILFMQAAIKYYGKICVDFDTKMEASQYIDFIF